MHDIRGSTKITDIGFDGNIFNVDAVSCHSEYTATRSDSREIQVDYDTVFLETGNVEMSFDGEVGAIKFPEIGERKCQTNSWECLSDTETPNNTL